MNVAVCANGQNSIVTSPKRPVRHRQEHPSAEPVGIAHIGLLLFMGGIIFSPTQILPALAVLRPQYSLAIIASIGFINGLVTGSRKLYWTPIQTWYALLMAVTALGLLNLIDVDLLSNGIDHFSNSIKTLVMLILIGSFASVPRLFDLTFNYYLLLVGLFQLHCMKAIVNGAGFEAGRFDSWVGQISNPDFIGTFFVCMVPIQLEMSLVQKLWLKRSLFLASTVLSIFIMVKTQTRAAFLGLVLIFFFSFFIREYRSARILLFLTLACSLVVFGILTKDKTQEGGGFMERIGTIFTSEAREKDQNAQSRLVFWGEGLRIWEQFPVLGTGIGGLGPYQSPEASQYTQGRSLSDHSLHESFIQMLAERGSLGGICFVMFLLHIFLYLSKIRRLQKEDSLPENYVAIATGLQLAMIGFMVGSLFMSVHESWILIFLAGFTSALYNVTVRSRTVAAMPEKANRRYPRRRHRT
jgi:O-antigen ligase